MTTTTTMMMIMMLTGEVLKLRSAFGNGRLQLALWICDRNDVSDDDDDDDDDVDDSMVLAVAAVRRHHLRQSKVLPVVRRQWPWLHLATQSPSPRQPTANLSTTR